jgi:hypothetical protein
LPKLKAAFALIERTVPPPRLVTMNGHLVYRFTERTAQQAIVLKLARVVTGLQAVWAVLHAGLTQEAAALQRILDELGSDIMFLAGPLTIGQREKVHDDFLTEFYQEEFDEGRTPVEATQKRHRVPRRKIRAYNARTYTADGTISQASAVLATVDSAYSGFVHAASVHPMDLYGGRPARFHVEGMYLTSRLDDSFEDFQNYVFRALTDAAVAARAVGEEDVFVSMRALADELLRDMN